MDKNNKLVTPQNIEVVNRWRLILGKFSERNLSNVGGEFQYLEISELLDFLYEREYDDEGRGNRKEGSLGTSVLTVPEWIHKVHNFFPKEVSERLENDALERYKLNEILTDKKVLESMKPNMNLLKNILSLKNRMRGEVLETARKIVKTVVDEITKKLENDITQGITGKINRNESSTFKIAKNFDFKKTIHKNLKNYDSSLNSIIPQQIYFNRRIKRFNPWNIIICVDESGSMMDSVIYSAIMAGIFCKLPVLRVSLVIFDTEVVDLSGYASDPVQTLMSVQLGGGTNIAKAMNYCETLIENMSRTIMVLVTDLYEGWSYNDMYACAKRIIESGAKLFILTGIDENSKTAYDKRAAATMSLMGAKVASVTPYSLAQWIGEVMK